MSSNIVYTKVNHFWLHRETWKLKNNDVEGKLIQVSISLIPPPAHSPVLLEVWPEFQALANLNTTAVAPKVPEELGQAEGEVRLGTARKGEKSTTGLLLVRPLSLTVMPWRKISNKEHTWRRNVESLITLYLQSLYSFCLVCFIGNPTEIDPRGKQGQGVALLLTQL